VILTPHPDDSAARLNAMAAATDPLDDFERGSHTGGGLTRAVYRSGDGPNCIVMAEIPGITPRVADFARRVRSLGCSVTLPVLFGEPGRPPSPGYIARSVTKACVSSEFAAFAVGRTAPISRWLRSLAAAEHTRCGGPGVGAVGMCFTGGFALRLLGFAVCFAFCTLCFLLCFGKFCQLQNT